MMIKNKIKVVFLCFLGIFLWIFGIIMLRLTGELGANLLWQIIGYVSSFLGMICLYYGISFFKTKIIFLLVLALCGRVVFVYYPVSDDFYRYAWEGKIQKQGINPYLVNPNHSSLQIYRDTLWSKINHKNFPAIYPPLSLLIFRAFDFGYPSPEFLRWFFIVVDMLSIILLWRILLHLRWKINSIVFYALNPSILVFFCGQMHLDVLQVHFLIWILYFYFKKKMNLMFLFLGFGIMIKYWLILLLPILCNGKNWHRCLFCILPFGLFYFFYEPDQNIFNSLIQFSELHFNSLFYRVFYPIFGENIRSVGILLGTFSLIFLLIEPRIERNILFVLLVFLFLSPTIHPWYLLLPLPILVLVPYWPFLWLNLFHFIGLLPMYQRNLDQGLWMNYSWSVYLVWIPFLVAVVVKFFQGRTNYPLQKKTYALIKNITVIMPTYNEEDIIQEQIQALEMELKDISHKILVVDGGSTDGTLDILKTMGVWCISAKKGRGFQIYEGIQKAVGDVCVIVHADCKISNQVFKNIIEKMNQNPDSIGGGHQMIFEHDTEFKAYKLKFIQYLNFIRAKFLNITFGDQIQFIRTIPARRISRPMYLMEDVFLALEIKREGLYLCQPSQIKVSVRKWKERNFAYSVWMIFSLVFQFLVIYRLKFFRHDSQYFIKRYYKKS